jgi:uncharacterized protein
MVIEFEQHSEDAIEFAHVYRENEIELDDETSRVTGELEIAGTARRNAAVAQVKGKLLGHLEVACGRCLQPVSVALDVNFDADFVTLETYEKADAEHQLSDGDFSVAVYDGEHIDIDEIVREQVLLNLPTKQICQETCAGLCQTCGVNKNSESCQCGSENLDPRWDALKELKIKN